MNAYPRLSGEFNGHCGVFLKLIRQGLHGVGESTSVAFSLPAWMLKSSNR